VHNHRDPINRHALGKGQTKISSLIREIRRAVIEIHLRVRVYPTGVLWVDLHVIGETADRDLDRRQRRRGSQHELLLDRVEGAAKQGISSLSKLLQQLIDRRQRGVRLIGEVKTLLVYLICQHGYEVRGAEELDDVSDSLGHVSGKVVRVKIAGVLHLDGNRTERERLRRGRDVDRSRQQQVVGERDSRIAFTTACRWLCGRKL